MKILYRLAKRLQFLDRLVPLSRRVPFRYFASEKVFGGLEPEMKLLPKLVSRNGVSIDVGANRGTYTYALAKLCRNVIAFEPIPDCVRSLKAWAAGKNVEIHDCALGEQKGQFTLYLPVVRGMLVTTRASLVDTEGQVVELPVQVRRLDDFELGNVCFIKVDVEGFELAVLKGATRIMRESHPNLLIEIDPIRSPENFELTFAWLASQNYDAHYLDDGGLRRCDTSIRRSRPDIYNFVFLPAGSGTVVNSRAEIEAQQS